MSYYQRNNTMDVIVNGRRERREVDYFERKPMNGWGSTRDNSHFMHVYMPKLAEDEQCLWNIGSDVPTIVKVSR